MSGGIHALRGFDYQATVILDLLYDHFQQRGASARARPEGLDDLDLTWMDGSTERRLYIQIKKPAEDLDGNRSESPWTLSNVASDLLPQTLTRLAGNTFEQRWVLGDEVTPEVKRLVESGAQAPVAAPSLYYEAVHLLARNQAGINKRWSVSESLVNEPADALTRVVDEFALRAKESGIDDQLITKYRAAATRVHEALPEVLARISVSTTFGTEQEVRKRVLDRLQNSLHLQRAVVEDTLFRNLRGFINDISKQHGRAFDHEELELEIRSVWPVMTPIRTPPALEEHYVSRADLADQIVEPRTGKAIEVVGISGSGKTSLASEAFDRITRRDGAVYYAAVQEDATFRNVLAGVAFHLRREGITAPFGLAVRPDVTDEQTIADMAGALSAVEEPMLLLVDLVHGTCSGAFARDLAAFVRVLTSSRFKLAVFGQESGLRELTPFEREDHGVTHLDVRGFQFEEFVTLVAQSHPHPDRPALWVETIFQKRGISIVGGAGRSWR